KERLLSRATTPCRASIVPTKLSPADLQSHGRSREQAATDARRPSVEGLNGIGERLTARQGALPSLLAQPNYPSQMPLTICPPCVWWVANALRKLRRATRRTSDTSAEPCTVARSSCGRKDAGSGHHYRCGADRIGGIRQHTGCRN